MSNYTTEVRYIVESTGVDIGLQDYPIFEESYRALLNAKIIDHYYFNEIGFETPERFIFEINKKMSEIMPFYNQMYLSTFLDIDPLVSFKRTIDKNESQLNTGTRSDLIESNGSIASNNSKASTNVGDNSVSSTVGTTDNQTSNDNKKMVESDTPSEQLLIGDIDDNVYASKAMINDDENSTERTTNVTEATTNIINEAQTDAVNENSVNTNKQNSSSEMNSGTTINNDEVQTGTNQSLTSLLMEYRNSFVNIDMLIIDELQSKFMLIMGDYRGGLQDGRDLYRI